MLTVEVHFTWLMCVWTMSNTPEAAGSFHQEKETGKPVTIYIPGGGAHCIMYHQLNPARMHQLAFCADCKKQLRLYEATPGRWG